MKNFFLVLEGFDSSGKTEISVAFSELCKRKKILSELTFEPGGTKVGGRIRKWLLNHPELQPKSKLMMFLTSRIEHYHQVILPKLNEQTAAKILICDRYFYSSFAYQGYLENIDPNLIFELHQKCGLFDRLPDLVIYLNPTLETLVHRMQKKQATSERDRFHELRSEDYIKRMLENYQKTFNFLTSKNQQVPVKMIATDNTSGKEVAEQIFAEIEKLWQKNPSSKYF